MNNRIIVALLSVILLAHGAIAQDAVPDGFVDCLSSPRQSFCWNETEAILQTNESFVFLHNADLNLTWTTVIRDSQRVYAGSSNSLIPSTVGVSGDLIVSSRGTLAVTNTLFEVMGDLVLRSDSVLVLDGSNASSANLVVHGCIVIEPNVTLRVEVAQDYVVSEPRSYSLIQLPTGCVQGQFANISLIHVQQSSGSGTITITGTSCPEPVGLAIIVFMSCQEYNPQVPQTSEPPSFEVIQLEPTPVPEPPVAPVQTSDGSIIIEIIISPVGSPDTEASTAPSPLQKENTNVSPSRNPSVFPQASNQEVNGSSTAVIDLTMILWIVGVVAVILFLVVAFLIFYHNSDKLRQRIHPFANRVAHVQQKPGHHSDVPQFPPLPATPYSSGPMWKGPSHYDGSMV